MLSFRHRRLQVIAAGVWIGRTSGNTGTTSRRWFRAQQCEQASYAHLFDLDRRGAGDAPQGTWLAEWAQETSTVRTRRAGKRRVAPNKWRRSVKPNLTVAYRGLGETAVV